VAKRAKKIASGKREEVSFEENLAALEEIVEALDQGELSLEESLARYEEGVSRLKACHALLAQAEQKIELLTGVDEEGRPETREFGHQASANKAASGDSSDSANEPAHDRVDDPKGLF